MLPSVVPSAKGGKTVLPAERQALGCFLQGEAEEQKPTADRQIVRRRGWGRHSETLVHFRQQLSFGEVYGGGPARGRISATDFPSRQDRAAEDRKTVGRGKQALPYR